MKMLKKMNQLQKQILFFVFMILALIALIVVCNLEDIKASLQKFIAEVRVEYTYGIDVEIESIYEDGTFAEEYSDETHKFDKDDKYYYIVARKEDTGMKLYAYTDDFYKPICSNYPEIKYSEKISKELDECIEGYISEDEYEFSVVYQNTMYFEECSYEEFKEDFGDRYVGDAKLYVDINVTNEQILNAISLKMERNIPIYLGCYRIFDDNDYIDLSERSIKCNNDIDEENEYRYFIDYGTENEVEVFKRDNDDSFDWVMEDTCYRDIVIKVNDADVNSILEQYKGHTISVTREDWVRTSEINEDNILDGNILKFENDYKREFTTEDWVAAEPYARFRMLDSLYEKVNLVGMTEDEIIEVLKREKCIKEENPDDGCDFHRAYLVEVDYKEGSKYLLLHFNDDKVVNYEVVNVNDTTRMYF